MDDSIENALKRLADARKKRLAHAATQALDQAEWPRKLNAMTAEERAAEVDLLVAALRDYQEAATKRLESERELTKRAAIQAESDRKWLRNNGYLIAFLTLVIAAATAVQAWAATRESKPAPAPIVNVAPATAPSITVVPAPVTVIGRKSGEAAQ